MGKCAKFSREGRVFCGTPVPTPFSWDGLENGWLMPEVPKSVYLVVGRKFSSKTVSAVSFHAPRSSTPGRDVERALRLRCPVVHVWLLDEEDYEAQGKNYLEGYEGVTADGTDLEPPVGSGPTTCNIWGSGPEVTTPQGRLSKTHFAKDGTTTPGEDVERALRAGSTSVSIEVTNWGASARPSN